ncbi:MAG: hypothetical protein ACO2O2_06495, partial [Acidilobaceae archaeon]
HIIITNNLSVALQLYERQLIRIQDSLPFRAFEIALRHIAFIGGAFTLTLILAFIVAHLVGTVVIHGWLVAGLV